MQTIYSNPHIVADKIVKIFLFSFHLIRLHSYLDLAYNRYVSIYPNKTGLTHTPLVCINRQNILHIRAKKKITEKKIEMYFNKLNNSHCTFRNPPEWKRIIFIIDTLRFAFWIHVPAHVILEYTIYIHLQFFCMSPRHRIK